jgi:chloramphenicol O-acetyltransferase type A
MITVDMIDNSTEFEKIAKEISLNQKDYFGIEKLAGRDDLIYITCLPWISFTHLSHTITINRNDSVPKISWGKYFTEGEKVLLPFSVQVHHALADGYQVSIYLDTLQKYLDSLS